MVLFYIILLLVHVFKLCYPGYDYKSLQAEFHLLFLFLLLVSTETQHRAKGRRKLRTHACSMELNGSSMTTFHCGMWSFGCHFKMLILLLIHQDQLMNHLLWAAFLDHLPIISHSLLCAPLCSGYALIIVYTTSAITPYYLVKCSFSLFDYEPLWRESVLLVLPWPWHIKGLIICWISK